MLPRMVRIRQNFPRPRVGDIPATVASTLAPEGQLAVLAHYGITEATMGCPLRATMDVVQVGEALGLPVWLDRHASEADWIGLVNRVKPHTDFKGTIESGLFKMMT